MKAKTPRARRPGVRILLIWIIEAIALVIMAWLLPNLNIDSAAVALVASAVIGLLNALLWPLLSFIIVPFAVLTLGLAALVMNGFIIWLASQIVDGFEVATIGTGVVTALGLTAINAILSSLLTIDDDASWYRNVVRRRTKRRAKPVETTVPGFIFLEIDGLSKPVLQKAMQEGFAPNLKRWLDSGEYELAGWETDLSSQTSASQAGILHGNNENIPAFRWYDRERKEIVASSSPDEVARLEKEHSDGNGLLSNSGASRGNLFSGDAPYVMTTASAIKDLSRFHLTDFNSYFLNPYNFTRTLLLMIWDIILEKKQFRAAQRDDIQPRLDKSHRGGKYPLLRVFTTIIMREINIYTLIGDMFAGVPAVYATFVGYDEVAHHSGVESYDALDVLRKLDEQFARLESVSNDETPRPYHIVVLSDHGQSGGPTFKQRYGYDLQELVRKAAKTHLVQAVLETNESWGHVNVVVNDVIKHDKQTGKAVKRAAGGKKGDDEVQLGPQVDEENVEPETRIIVLASGNLGLVYSTERDQRVNLEEIEEILPGMLDSLVAHEGIGFVMVHSKMHGPVAISRSGRYYLAEDRIEGENPLALFSPHAAQHLLRYDAFPDAPDLYVNSIYDVERNEVAAFEELIGSHGGMGGYQTQPFILHPTSLEITEPHLVGAAAVYRQLKQWVETQDKVV